MDFDPVSAKDRPTSSVIFVISAYCHLRHVASRGRPDNVDRGSIDTRHILQTLLDASMIENRQHPRPSFSCRTPHQVRDRCGQHTNTTLPGFGSIWRLFLLRAATATRPGRLWPGAPDSRRIGRLGGFAPMLGDHVAATATADGRRRRCGDRLRIQRGLDCHDTTPLQSSARRTTVGAITSLFDNWRRSLIHVNPTPR
jgi:hypothetical protein